MSQRDLNKPTTSKRAKEDDEEQEQQDEKLNIYKRRSASNVLQFEPTNVLATRHQRALFELKEQQRILQEEKRRPLFFKSKIKAVESPAISLYKKSLRSDPGDVWGDLEFYEGKSLISTLELKGSEALRIDGKVLLNLGEEDEENLAKYSDWEHALGDGFLLQRFKDQNVVRMQSLSVDDLRANKYKIFASNHQYFLNPCEDRTIYEGREALQQLSEVKDMTAAYDFTKNAYIAVVIIGKYMGMLQELSASLNRDFISNMPYWILIKLRPEFLELDRHLLKVIKFV